MTKPKDASQLKGKASKLTREDVVRIREIGAKGTQSARELARFYGVGAETVRRVLRGETWTDVSMLSQESEALLEVQAAASYERMLQGIAAEKERRAAGDKMVEEIKTAPQAVPSTGPYSWLKSKNPLDE